MQKAFCLLQYSDLVNNRAAVNKHKNGGFTCSCEPFDQCMSQLTRSNEPNAHPAR